MAKNTRKSNEVRVDSPENTIEVASAPAGMSDTRVIYCGDCLEQLQQLPNECVDLIYIDPPLNSKRNYEVFLSTTKKRLPFEDGSLGTRAYIEYMQPRCAELRRVLKKTGSFYYHCDWRASHYVKMMLDQIFGENNFESEIIWKRYGAPSNSRGYGVVHDTIFYYGGGGQLTFNTQFEPFDKAYVEERFKHQDSDGRRWTAKSLNNPAPSPKLMYSFRAKNGITYTSPDNGWKFTKETMTQLDEQNRLHYPNKQGGRLQLKSYLDEMSGIPISSVWTDISLIGGISSERVGYPTQKPIALLDRIVKTSSNPNDIVLDAFCGCGTALVAAQNLGRRWIGIDVSPTACRIMASRLRDVCHMRESEPNWRAHRTDAFVVRDLPWTIEKLKQLPPFEFENWAVIALGRIPNNLQVGDMGMDGRIFPVGTKPTDEEGGGLSLDDWFPIQVKQSDKVDRPDIEAFEVVMEREGKGGRQRGFFVAFGFTTEAERECAAFNKRTGRIIKLLTVQEILDEEHIQRV